MTPATSAKLGKATGRLLLILVWTAGGGTAALGLGLSVGLFWRAVRFVNGW